jgi:hypothetical protein
MQDRMNGGEKKELDERVDKGGDWEMAGVRVGDHRRLWGRKKKSDRNISRLWGRKEKSDCNI